MSKNNTAVVILELRGVDADNPTKRVPRDYISRIDMEVSLDITANDLVLALNETFLLGIDTNKIVECYLYAEEPIALIRGNKTLNDIGIRNATIIHADRRR